MSPEKKESAIVPKWQLELEQAISDLHDDELIDQMTRERKLLLGIGTITAYKVTVRVLEERVRLARLHVPAKNP